MNASMGTRPPRRQIDAMVGSALHMNVKPAGTNCQIDTGYRLFVGEGVDGIFLRGLPCGVKCTEQ